MMKVLLKLVRRDTRVAQAFMGGPSTMFDACLLSTKPDAETKKRSRLMFPGGLPPYDADASVLRDRCLAHLLSFGFAADDIEVHIS